MSALDYLYQLSTNRFALQNLAPSEHQHIYRYLQNCFMRPSSEHQHWYLIGTDGCHLCDIAYQTIQQAFTICPQAIPLQRLDLIDADDEALIDTLGRCIPILLTPTRLLAYPFGVMDVASMLHKIKNNSENP